MATNPTYFQERKDFLARMMKDVPKGAWRAEMGFTKKIFGEWPLDFLEKVAPPFPNMNSVKYFIGKDGREYLKVQLNAFNFKPEFIESIAKEEKVGEDLPVSKVQTIRELLDG